jgi:hypothetical protein
MMYAPGSAVSQCTRASGTLVSCNVTECVGPTQLCGADALAARAERHHHDGSRHHHDNSIYNIIECVVNDDIIIIVQFMLSYNDIIIIV